MLPCSILVSTNGVMQALEKMNVTVCIDQPGIVNCDLLRFTFRSEFCPNERCFHFNVDGSDNMMQTDL